MFTYSVQPGDPAQPVQPVHVRPEMDRMAAYIPGESLETFSSRTGIPI